MLLFTHTLFVDVLLYDWSPWSWHDVSAGASRGSAQIGGEAETGGRRMEASLAGAPALRCTRAQCKCRKIHLENSLRPEVWAIYIQILRHRGKR